MMSNSTTLNKRAGKYTLPTLLLLCGCLFGSCVKEEIETFDGMGKRPIYVPASSLGDIKNLPPQPIAQTGTIFLLDTLFFLMEQKKGIHVYSLQDSLNPVYLTFFNIPVVSDFTIANNRLYADSWKDLVTIDISDLYNIRVVDRKTDVFAPILYPPLYNGYFECVDESRGAVVGWEDVYLEKARCHTVN